MKVIAIDSVHPILYDQLRSFGCTVDECSHLKGEELLKILPQYEGFIIRSKFKITKEIITVCPHLKFIARSGSGMENIDLEFVLNVLILLKEIEMPLQNICWEWF